MDNDELKQAFDLFDKNGDGTLSRQELIESYTDIMGDVDSATEEVRTFSVCIARAYPNGEAARGA